MSIRPHRYYGDGPADIRCPFCGENDFDKYGLKYHLMVFGCDEFEKADQVQVQGGAE